MVIKELTIEVSHKCNYNCIHCSSCYIKGHITPDKVIEIIKKYDPESIRYSGGEPFEYLSSGEYPLDFKYPYVLKSRKLLVTTSGQYPDSVLELEDKFDEIRLSIYGFKKFHDGVTGHSGSFRSVVDLTRKLIEKRGSSKYNGIVITSPIWNRNQSNDVVVIAEQLGVEYKLLALVPNTTKTINLLGNSCSTGHFDCHRKEKILIMPNLKVLNCAVEKRGFDCYYKD